MPGNPFPLSQSVSVIAEGIRGGERDEGEVGRGGGIKEESGRRQKVCNGWAGSRRGEDGQDNYDLEKRSGDCSRQSQRNLQNVISSSYERKQETHTKPFCPFNLIT